MVFCSHFRKGGSSQGAVDLDKFGFAMFGGYDKLETLKYVDLLTSHIYQLEDALGSKNRGENYTIPDEVGPFDLKVSALGGFDKGDVDAYINELNEKIRELRRSLQADEA